MLIYNKTNLPPFTDYVIEQSSVVVCIDIEGTDKLTIYKKYIVINDELSQKWNGYEMVYNKNHDISFFDPKRFVSLPEYRKLKISDIK